MTIQPLQSNAILDSIDRMNDLLKQVTNVKMDFDNRMMKTEVRSQVESQTQIPGLGENIDVSA